MIPLDKVLALARVPASLAAEQSIHTLDELAEAARAHRLRSLPGLNISLEYHILRCIGELCTAGQGILMDVAHFQADEVMRWLAGHEGVERAAIVSALRRGKGLVRAVEVLAAARDPAGVLRSFARSSLVKESKVVRAPDVNVRAERAKPSGLKFSPEGASLSQHGALAPCEAVSTLGLPVTLYAVVILPQFGGQGVKQRSAPVHGRAARRPAG